MVFYWALFSVFILCMHKPFVCMEVDEEFIICNKKLMQFSSEKNPFKLHLQQFETERMQKAFDIKEKHKAVYGTIGILMDASNRYLEAIALATKKPFDEKTLLHCRSEYVSFVQDEIDKKEEGTLYGSTPELYKLAFAYNVFKLEKLIGNKKYEPFIDEDTFSKQLLPLLVSASRSPNLIEKSKLYDTSLLFALAWDPQHVNQLIYEYNEFAFLTEINKYNSFTLANIKELFLNTVWRKPEDQKMLKIETIFYDIIDQAEKNKGYVLNNLRQVNH